jgi:hypothetical protein
MPEKNPLDKFTTEALHEIVTPSNLYLLGDLLAALSSHFQHAADTHPDNK